MLAKMKFSSSICKENGTSTIVTTENNLSTVCITGDTSHKFWSEYKDHGSTIEISKHEEIVDGVWLTGSLNFNHEIDNAINLLLIEEFPHLSKSGDILTGDDRFLSDIQSYIVCDSPKQAMSYWSAAINNSTNNFIISLCPIYREHEYETGGWRWHKWGRYIGTQNPQHEYLYDDKHIDLVYCATIYVVKEK